MNVPKTHIEFFYEDVINTLKGIRDSDGNPLYGENVWRLGTESHEAKVLPAPLSEMNQCPCALWITEPGEMITPAVNNFAPEIFQPTTLYLVHDPNMNMDAVSSEDMVERLFYYTIPYLEDGPDASNPNYIARTPTIANAELSHWEWRMQENERLSFENVYSIRFRRSEYVLPRNLLARMIRLPSSWVLTRRPM